MVVRCSAELWKGERKLHNPCQMLDAIIYTIWDLHPTTSPRQQLHGLGVRVLRMGLCSAKEPYSLESWRAVLQTCRDGFPFKSGSRVWTLDRSQESASVRKREAVAPQAPAPAGNTSTNPTRSAQAPAAPTAPLLGSTSKTWINVPSDYLTSYTYTFTNIYSTTFSCMNLHDISHKMLFYILSSIHWRWFPDLESCDATNKIACEHVISSRWRLSFCMLSTSILPIKHRSIPNRATFRIRILGPITFKGFWRVGFKHPTMPGKVSKSSEEELLSSLDLIWIGRLFEWPPPSKKGNALGRMRHAKRRQGHEGALLPSWVFDCSFFPKQFTVGFTLKEKRGVHRLARACSVGRGVGVAWAWHGRNLGLGVAWA